MKYEEMIKLAAKASENAYVPYSKFPVGACVLAESGNVYTGCNFDMLGQHILHQQKPLVQNLSYLFRYRYIPCIAKTHYILVTK